MSLFGMRADTVQCRCTNLTLPYLPLLKSTLEYYLAAYNYIDSPVFPPNRGSLLFSFS